MALYFPIIANTCDSFLVFLYPVLCYFSFWSELPFRVCPLVSCKHWFYVRLCLCACVCVCSPLYCTQYFRFWSKNHTNLDRSPYRSRLAWRKMEMKENVFVCHISLSTREIWSQVHICRTSNTLQQTHMVAVQMLACFIIAGLLCLMKE